MFSKEEKYFLLRRLHSLAGIIPIGAFFLEHLFSNAISLKGPAAYNEMVEKLMAIPFLPVIEISVIAIPLLFHIILGIVIYLTSKNNALQYPHFNNWRYFLQRLTGLIGIIYIGYHVWETRIHSVITGEHVTYAFMQEELREPGMFWFYLVGALSLTYHFANGLFTFLITWGLTISPRSQKISTLVCSGLFVALSAVWVQILLNFVGWM
ncbi:MAG: succinate dehydrogenase [Deltaproteobacteria bacterium]|nr:succinate dehydrogenase [Deltaproteobacteria bacterium]